MCAGYTLQFVHAFPTVCTVLWEGTVWFNAEFPFISQRGVCGCERGYTEVMRSNGFLDYCVKVPGLEDKKADVKTIAGKNKPVNSKMHDIFKGWSIQPFNPDGKLKIWVYGVSAGGFFIIVFLIFTSYLMCKKNETASKPSTTAEASNPGLRWRH